MTTEFWIGLILAVGANVATLAASFGSFSARLKALERKVDKHNNFVERLATLEAEKTDHERRLNQLEN